MAISPLALGALLQASTLQPLLGARARPVDLLLSQFTGTQVSLSSFGRLQSVVGGLADAAAGLRGSRAESGVAVLQGALERFVAAVNTGGRVTESLLLTGLFSRGSVRLDDSAALVATSELLRSVDDPLRNGGVEPSLLGISRQPDGALRFDASIFTQAFTDDPQAVVRALNTLGQNALDAATRELGAGGRLNAATATFDFLLASFQSQQLGVALGEGDEIGTLNALLLAGNPFLFQGVAAFRQIAGL